jgi:hypothetical protein
MTWKQVKPAAGNGSAAKKTGETKQPIQRKRHMKKFILISTMAATLAFAAGTALAVGGGGGNLILNVSGTIKYQNENDEFVGTVGSHSLNEANVYTLISNAVANASSFSEGGITSTHLPANGYIAYSPGRYDGEVEGTFYVTNKTGFHYLLSGVDTNGNYYSWIELDTIIYYGDDSSLYLGWYDAYNPNTGDVPDIFEDIASYSYVTKTGSTRGNGSANGTSAGVFYIHDDPYNYEDSGYPYVMFDDDDIFGDNNDNALEIRGIVTANFTIKDFDITSGTISIAGGGNFYSDYYDSYGVVSGGTAKLSP